jgi:undecaprenyl-diphosphatase
VSVHWGWLVGGVALALYLAVRRRAHGPIELGIGGVAAIGAVLVGLGIVPLPDLEAIIEDAGQALGRWTYLLVGLLAFLETGAFVGLVAPGETAVIVGGLVAGQGRISLPLLIAIVWTCAVLGDVCSYLIGRRLGREFMVRHGGRVKITEARLEQVERFFEKHGGPTILIGRFIGLVRAIAPFIAGASRMPMRRFLPYDVLGAGLWATTFCLLGYVFWRSFDQLTQWVSRGLFAFGAAIVLLGAVIFLVRLARDEGLRARTAARLDDALEHPVLRPAAPGLRAVGRRLRGPAAFAAEKLVPGREGLELITLLAIAAVGSFALVSLGAWAEARTLPLADREAFRLGDELYAGWARDIVLWLSALGSFPAALVAVLGAGALAVARGRREEALALVAGLLLTWLLVEVLKGAYDRPRPDRPHVDVARAAYPSGHAAYAVAWIGAALVLVRAGVGAAAGAAPRLALVAGAILLVALIGLSRVYLRAHHLTDVLGGLGAGAAVFALCGAAALTVARVRHNGVGTAG